MTSIRDLRRLSAPVVLAVVAALAVVLVPSSPASAAAQGIAGTVTTSGSTPLPDIEVDFYVEVSGGYWGYADTALTDATGSYVESLPAGSYRVSFSDPNGQYAEELFDNVTTFDDATTVTVTPGNVSQHVDADLAVAGHITGRVVTSGGAPIADAWIDAYTFDGQQWNYAPAWGYTDQNGDYDVSAAPGTYRLEFNADGYLGEFYDDVSTVEAGTSVTVASGQTLAVKDAVLEQQAVLSGSVTLPSDAAPDDADRVVTVYDTQSGDLVDQEWLDPADETSPGSRTYPWSSVGLPAGSYRVQFGFVSGQATSEAEYYDNHPESAGAASADKIQLAAGEQRTGVDATLRTGGTISGRVVDGNGDPLAACEVLAVNPSDQLIRVGTTASDGTFAVAGLTTGHYDLVVGYAGASGPCGSSEYYTNASGDLSPSPAGVIAVSAAPGSDTAMPATLVYQGSLPTVANTAAPTVPSAAPAVGSPVSADPGTWDPADVTLTYQWRANDVPIAGATSASYTPDGSVIGMRLSVTVTASRSGYNAGTATSNQTAAVLGTASATTVSNYSPPSVTGTARVGFTLVSDRGSWTDGATTTLQWLRDGSPIAGATGPTYSLGPADVGARIALRVTATKNGLSPAVRTTAQTGPVQLGILTVTGLPQLLGTLKVGKIVRAVPQTSSPAGTAVKYRWLRNGVPIKGRAAKQARYQLVGADRGKRISVRITLLRPGYASNVLIATKRGRVR